MVPQIRFCFLLYTIRLLPALAHLNLPTLPHNGVWFECRDIYGEVTTIRATPTRHVHAEGFVWLLVRRERRWVRGREIKRGYQERKWRRKRRKAGKREGDKERGYQERKWRRKRRKAGKREGDKERGYQERKWRRKRRKVGKREGDKERGYQERKWRRKRRKVGKREGDKERGYQERKWRRKDQEKEGG